MKSFLKTLSLFDGLDENQYEFLEESIHTQLYQKHQMVFSEGDEASSLYVARSGMVKMYRARIGTEKEEIVCLIKPGGYFCLAPVLCRETLHIHAQMIQAGELIVIPREVLQRLIKISHPFAQTVVRKLALKECQLCDKVCNLSLKTTKERLAAYLLEEWKRAGARSVRLPLNQSQIASSLGTVRETVSRDLSDLKKARIIELKDSQLTVLEAEDLKQIAGI